MYEYGKQGTFESDKYFTGYWYHIATNQRPKSSLWSKIKGENQTCGNVITEFKKLANQKIGYINGCYKNGVYNEEGTRGGTVTVNTANPGSYAIVDSHGGKPMNLHVLATDYDHYAVVTNDSGIFWLFSRESTICTKSLKAAKKTLTELGFDISNVSIDYQTLKSCSS